MLTIELDAQDLGRIRFAEAPAPVLEISLMLLELRQRPRPARHSGLVDGNGHDWHGPARTMFTSTARALLALAPTRRFVYLLDVLTADPQEAFQSVYEDPSDARREADAEQVHRMNLGSIPVWPVHLQESAPAQQELERALRSFHSACIAPRWSQATGRFQRDLLTRTALLRNQGVATLLNTLSPHMHLRGLTLESAYPWERRVRLNGRGLVLMPSAFWTGYPVITWINGGGDYMLIYPARQFAEQDAKRRDARTTARARDSLATLLGPTRAAVLRTLRRPLTTSALAGHVGISLSSASRHAAALQASGLVISERQGQMVVHRISDLGSALLWHDF